VSLNEGERHRGLGGEWVSLGTVERWGRPMDLVRWAQTLAMYIQSAPYSGG